MRESVHFAVVLGIPMGPSPDFKPDNLVYFWHFRNCIVICGCGHVLDFFGSNQDRITSRFSMFQGIAIRCYSDQALPDDQSQSEMCGRRQSLRYPYSKSCRTSKPPP